MEHTPYRGIFQYSLKAIAVSVSVVDYNGNLATYTRKSYKEEIAVMETDIWNALYNDLYCYCTAAELRYYTELQSEESEEGTVIHFVPSEEIRMTLLDYYMACYMNYNDYDDFAEGSTHEFRDGSGTLRLDSEGRLRSVEFSADICRTAVSGRTVDGTLTYKKEILAYDDAVTLPGAEEEEALGAA